MRPGPRTGGEEADGQRPVRCEARDSGPECRFRDIHQLGFYHKPGHGQGFTLDARRFKLRSRRFQRYECAPGAGNGGKPGRGNLAMEIGDAADRRKDVGEQGMVDDAEAVIAGKLPTETRAEQRELETGGS